MKEFVWLIFFLLWFAAFIERTLALHTKEREASVWSWVLVGTLTIAMTALIP